MPDVHKKPGRKKRRPLKPKQEKFVNTLLLTGDKKKALKSSGYSLRTDPMDFKPVQDALADRQKEMMKRFLDNAEEMKNNMIELARNANSESVKFQATKDILDRAGLNPINKNQTESAKYVSVESRFSRDALSRYEKELQAKEAGK